MKSEVAGAYVTCTILCNGFIELLVHLICNYRLYKGENLALSLSRQLFLYYNYFAMFSYNKI